MTVTSNSLPLAPRRLTIAVVGLGLIGHRHAQTVLENRNSELVAVVDPTPAGEKSAATLGIPYFDSVQSMLASTKPDAAIICTPNNTHVALAKELSSAGVHILVEKPVSADIASGKDLLAHLKGTNGVHVLVGHHRRFNPYMIAAKRIISEGLLGTVVAINGTWTTRKPLEYFAAPTDWRQGQAGGVILINMVHEVDLLQLLFGPINRVYAEKTKSLRGFEAEEGAALTIRFESGIVGSFVISDNTPSPHNFESGTGENPLIPKTGQDFYRIFGTNASLSVPDMRIWSHKGDSGSWVDPISADIATVDDGVPFQKQLEHFIRVVNGQEPPICTVEDGLSALVVCEAIKNSLSSESVVTIQ